MLCPAVPVWADALNRHFACMGFGFFQIACLDIISLAGIVRSAGRLVWCLLVNATAYAYAYPTVRNCDAPTSQYHEPGTWKVACWAACGNMRFTQLMHACLRNTARLGEPGQLHRHNTPQGFACIVQVRLLTSQTPLHMQGVPQRVVTVLQSQRHAKRRPHWRPWLAGWAGC